MPVTITLNKEEGVVYTTVTGRCTADDVIEAFDELFARTDYRAGMNGIADLRAAETFPPYTDVVRIARYVVGHRDQIGESKAAVVVSSDVSFGTTRMFQSYSGESMINTRIFYEMDEARRWLGLDDGEGE